MPTEPRRKARSRVAAGLALALLGGCKEARDNLPREAVSGKVSVEGEPLARGAILFKSPTGATDAGGLIRDGEYRLGAHEGPVPGAYKVMITEEVDRPKDDGGKISLRPQAKATRIGPKYNADTILTSEVKAGGPNTFDFDLKKTDDREPPPARGRGWPR
jgi:hypothetical protein